LEEKATAQKRVPILWSHNALDTPIGYCERCFEDTDGLVVEGQLLLHDPRAQSVHTLMQKRAVSDFSFGFVAAENSVRFLRENGVLVRELSRVDLIEVSPVLMPANDQTALLSIKRGSLEQRHGAVLSHATKTHLQGIKGRILAAVEDLSVFLDDPSIEIRAQDVRDRDSRYYRWKFKDWP
jgi:HK97 family phage prohead protease